MMLRMLFSRLVGNELKNNAYVLDSGRNAGS